MPGDDQQQQTEGGEQQQQQEQEQQQDGRGFKPPQTAEELNELIQQRIERERSKYAEAVEKAAELDKLREAEKTETQRLSDALAESERLRAERESELQRVRLDRAIETKAVALGFVDPEAASKLVDREQVTVSDDGTPDLKTVEAALTALIESKPYLRGQGTKQTGKADQGVRSNGADSGGSGPDMDELLRRALGR